MEKLMMDLQMFAEEEETAAVGEAADVGQDAAADTPAEEPPKDDIPEELDGLPEEIAREVMAEANGKAEDGNGQAEGSDADQDSDNKPVDEQQKPEPNQKIPYQRFKQQVDKANDLEAQLAAYRQKFGDINAPAPAAQPQPQPQQAPVQQTAPQPPQLNFSPDAMAQIQNLVKQRAMQITGMTQDDVDSLEYADENDQRKGVWKNALRFAESDVYAGIRQAQMQRAQEVQRLMKEHEEVVASFNQYTEKEQASPEFQQIQAYATDAEHGYPSKLSQADRNIIVDAYQRILRNTASAQDVFLVRNYYEQAKADYFAQKGKPQRPANKPTQQKAHPRSEQISGASSPDGGVSVEQLKDMLVNKDWKDIPEKYRNMMLGL